MRALSIVPIALLLAACAGSGYQRIPVPDLDASVPGDRCRVYLARADTTAGSIRNVRVFDGETEIGVIHEDEFLCWERQPERGFGRAVFEGLGPNLAAVESVFDLPREPGTTSYYSIRIVYGGHKPEITLISSEEGRALIEQRSPAKGR
jgi:hypothetical protein